MKTLATLRRAILLISLPFGILHFALPIYGQEIGANAVEIGLFFSAFSLMTVLLRPVVGAALDRYGRRPFFLAGLIGYAATMFAFALIEQVWGIVVARLFQGAASSFLWLSARAITADVAGEDARGRAFGGVDQASNQGAILGTFIGFAILLGGFEIHLSGQEISASPSSTIGARWMLLFSVYGIVCLLAALLAWRSLPETNPGTAGDPHSPSPIVWSRPWVLLLTVTAVTGASWAMLSPILMIFLQQKLAVGIDALAWAYLPAATVWAVLPTRLGALADRFGRKPSMVLGMAVAAASSFFIPGLASLAGLAALWALQALCYAAGDPAEQALVADLTGGDQRGRAYGLYTLAAGLGTTVGPLMGGWLYEAIGPHAPFVANGVVLAVCAGVLWALLEAPARKAAPL
ncbi:MAG: MFS transporter [Chloroflexota bacterium]